MKVLITVEFYWPHLGGAEAVCQRVAEGLAARGHDIHVATTADPARAPGPHNGVTIHGFNIRGNEVKGLKGDVEAYRHFLHTFACDAMLNYAAQSWTTDIAMQELPFLSAKRLVLAPCGYSGLSTPARRLVYRNYFARLPERLRRYDLLIYHSDTFRDAEFGRRHGLTNSMVISNGVDVEEFAGPRGTFRAKHDIGDTPLIVNISNHYRLKGHDRYVSLARKLREHAYFALVGRDTARFPRGCHARCCRAAKRNNRVVLVDGPRAEAVAALRDADLVVHTSRSEVAPLVPLEAAAAGVPWVSYDVGNVSLLKGGEVVNSHDELVRVVQSLLANRHHRAELGSAGAAYAAEHDWSEKVTEYERALTSMAAATSPDAG